MSQSLYVPDVARCRECGTTRPGKYLAAGVCNDDWHGHLEAPDESLLAELHAPKSKPKPKESR